MSEKTIDREAKLLIQLEEMGNKLNEALEELEWRRLDSQIVTDILEVIDPYIDKNDHSKSVDEWIKELIKQLRFAKAKVAEVELVLDGYLEYGK